jgi:tetratricopeptide (TPR) repeat protein
MSRPKLLEEDKDELALLVEQARSAEAPELDASRRRRMVRTALLAARPPAPDGGAPRLTRYALSLAAALLMGLLGARAFEYAASSLASNNRIEVAPNGVPLRRWLRTGDALVLAQNSAIEVQSETPARRSVRLDRGAVLFDVAHLAQGQGFEVQTAHARVQVRGTVFSVRVDAAHTIVQVHEGRVLVAGRVLEAGDHWSSSGEAAGSERTLFAAEVRAALAARQADHVHSEPRAFVEPVPVSEPVRAPAAASTPLSPAQPRATDAQPAPASPRPASAAAPLTLEAAEQLLREGQADIVLRALGEHSSEPRYARVLADALRATGDFERAIAAYEKLAAESQGSLRAQAGFAAGQLALGPLHDPVRALGEVQLFDLTADTSPLRERARVLRVNALQALGRSDEARAAAREYLAQEPETETSARLRRLVDAGAEW